MAVSVATVAGGVSAQGGGAAAFYEDALVRFETDDYQGAIVQLKNALQADPENLPARILLGRCHLRLGAGAAAEEELRAARARGADENLILVPLARAYLMERKFDRLFDEASPRDRPVEVQAELYLILGQAYLETRRMPEADEHFHQAAVLRPADAAAYLGRAVVALHRGRYREAEKFIEQAAPLAPRSAEVWYLKGEVSRLGRDPRAAVGHYDKAIALEARHVAARSSRAGALMDLGENANARKDVDFVLALLPEDPKAVYLNALLLAREGKPDESRAVLEVAARSLKSLNQEYLLNHGPSLLLAGVVKHAQGNDNEAYAYLNRYVGMFPHQPGARKLLGDILLRRGDVARAIVVLEPAARSAPDDLGLLALLGNAYMRSGDPSKATAIFELAAARSPDDAVIQLRLARNRLAVGEDDRAVAHLNTALAMDPGFARAGLMLGFVELVRGDPDAALEAARDVIARDPANPVAYNLIGAVQVRRQQWSEARASFEKAVSLDPGYVTAHLNLGRLEVREGRARDAERRYRALLDGNPENVQVMVELARLARSRNRTAEAIAWLEKVRAARPDGIAEQVVLVDLYVRAGKAREALAVAQGLEERAPEDLYVLEAVGKAQMALEQHTKAEVTFRRMSRYAVYSAPWLTRIAAYQAGLGDVDGARWSLAKAIAATPDYLEARSALVALDARAGDTRSALDRARRIRDEHPSSPLGDTLMGDVHMVVGQADKARAAYEAAWAKGQSSALAVRLFRARRASGESARAVAHLEQWLADHPRDGAARRVLASAHARDGRTRQAIAEYERLTVDDPSDALLLNNLASLYQKTGDPRALETAEKAYRQAPRNPAVADTLGWILVKQGRAERGLVHLREAYSRASREPEVRFHLAVALNDLGRTQEARGHLEGALAAGRDFDGAAEARALMESISGG
jgi:putative PEP-CTERM system TPR-repeat lipoprotein